MIFAIGETLIDKFPTYSRIGGAPLNFSIHALRFSLPVLLAGRTGRDEEGRQILDFMSENSLDTGFIQIDDIHETGKVEVAVNSNTHSFNIKKDAAYDYIETELLPDEILGKSECLYFGTLVQRTDNGKKAVRYCADKMPRDSMVFCDLNLRPGCYTEETVIGSLEMCSVLKLNDEELQYLKDIHNLTLVDQSSVIWLKEKYNIDTAAVTRGAEGAELFHAGKYIKGKSENSVKVIDTVGAGDAFSAVLVKGLLDKWHPETIMEKALDFSSAVCGIKGALPGHSEKEFYEKIIPVQK